jgi:peroxiredoxin
MTSHNLSLKRTFESVIIALPLLVAAGYVGYARALAPKPMEQHLLVPGKPLPEMRTTDGSGAGTTTLTEEVGSNGAIILVVHPDCPHCHTELEALENVSTVLPSTVVVVSVGDSAQTEAFREQYPYRRVLLDVDRVLHTQYGVSTVPLALAVSDRSVIAAARLGVGGIERVVEALRGGI